MKTLLSRKTLVIAAVAVLIAIITVVSVNVFESSGPVTGLANAVTRPVKALAASVAQMFEGIYSAIYRYEDLQEKYEKALRDYADLEAGSREYSDLLVEVVWLRAVLDFRERHAGHIYEEATVGNWSSANWSSSFTIDKGYANSDTPVARGNSVITEYGVLIGQVTEVRATASTVVSVLDTTFSAAVYVGDSSEDSVTVKGDFTLMSSGLLILDHLSDDIIVLPGDSVVTSSAGGVFPVGLVIGEVVEVLRHDTGVGRYAIVRPIRDIDVTIKKVLVITSYDITG